MASFNPSGYRSHLPPPTKPPPPPPTQSAPAPVTSAMDHTTRNGGHRLGSSSRLNKGAGGGGMEVTNGASQSRLQMSQVGVWCERCNNRLVELKKQALRLMIMHPSLIRLAMKDSSALHERLHIPKSLQEAWNNDQCEVCTTHVNQLKQEAVGMVQSLEETQAPKDGSSLNKLNSLMGSRDLASLQRYLYVHQQNGSHPRSSRQGKYPPSSASTRLPQPQIPIAMQAQQYLEKTLGSAWWAHPKLNMALSHYQASFTAPSTGKGNMADLSSLGRPAVPQSLAYMPSDRLVMTTGIGPVSVPPVSRSGPPNAVPVNNPAATQGTSAAASFFARAAQKFNLSSKKKKQQGQPPHLQQHYQQQQQQQQHRQMYPSQHAAHQRLMMPDALTMQPEQPLFPTNFSEVLSRSPPVVPPALLRNVGRVKDNPGVGKVKVMLRVVPSSNPNDNATFVTVDQKKKQVTLFDPTFLTSNYVTPANRRTGVTAPKMFAFDNVFSQDATQTEICSGAVADIVQSVVNGADGCLFCYGHSRLGKTFTMMGSDESSQNLGIIPCAISWLFRLINEKKERTSTRFSVRVSAVEVYGKQENLRDLLTEQANGSNNGCGTSPALYLQEDPICGVQLLNQSELRAPTAEKAAFYLDAAIAARLNKDRKVEENDDKYSHMLFTLHVYQYRIDKQGGKGGVIGGRSRLHLIDLGSGDKSGGKIVNGVALSYSALGQVVLALMNNAKHIPNRDSKLTRLLREAMGSLTCRTVMIAHVSAAIHCYNETLGTIQLASRIHRMRKKKSKYSSTSSSGGESSCDEGRRRHGRSKGHGFRGMRVTNALQQSDPEYISSSEQSCDTVIYVGPDGSALSDRDLTDNEGPPESLPIWRPPNLDSPDEDEEEDNTLEALKEEDEEEDSDEKKDDSDEKKDEEMEDAKTETTNPAAVKTETMIDDPAVTESSSSSNGSPQKRNPGKSSLPVSVQRSSPTKGSINGSPVRNSPKTNGSLKPQAYNSVNKSSSKKTPPLDSPPCIERPKDLPSGFGAKDESAEDEKSSVASKPKIPPRSSTGQVTMSAGLQRAQQLEMEQGQNHIVEEEEEEQNTSANNHHKRAEDEDAMILSKLKHMDLTFSQFQAVQPETPSSESIKDAEMLLGLTSEEAKVMMENTLRSLAADADCAMQSVNSFDNLSGILGKPMSEISEDELSLAFSEQETLSFVSRDTEDVESFHSDNFTVDDLPMGIEALTCVRELEKRSLDSYSENPSLSLSLNGASVNGCINEPYLLLDKEERNKLGTQSISHYMYSDDESEAGDKEKRKKMCSQVSDIETFESVSLASHDLEAIKSMYVISSLNMDSLGLLDDDYDKSQGKMPQVSLAETLNFLHEEPSVVTYMTINNDEQVVMREKHLAIDHPLRRLSCISDATDATFSTASRPASYMDLQEDDLLTDAGSGEISPEQYLSKNDNSPHGLHNRNVAFPSVSEGSPASDVFDLTQLYSRADLNDNDRQTKVTHGVTTNVPNGVIPSTTTTIKVTNANAQPPVWERKSSCDSGPKSTQSTPLHNRTISHLDTGIIMPGGNVNMCISRSCQSSPARKGQAVDETKVEAIARLMSGEAVAKLQAAEALRESSAPTEQCAESTNQLVDSLLVDGKYPLQQAHISKSGPASYFSSPQHKGKLPATSRMRSLSHQPSPLILSAAIERAKKQMQIRQEAADVGGFFDTDVPIPEMWLLRQPDGAPDNETDECVTTPHTNTPAYYATIDECKELNSVLCSAERPPAIGACAAPAFEVEVNPCFSHEYDEVLKSTGSLTQGHNVIVQHCTSQLGDTCMNCADKFGHFPMSALSKTRPLPKLPYQEGKIHRQAQCSVSDSEFSRVPIMSCKYGRRTADKAPRLYASDSEYTRVPVVSSRMHRTDSYGGHSSAKHCKLPYKSNSTNSINTQRCPGSGKSSKKAPQTSKLQYPSQTCPSKKSHKSKLPSNSKSDQALMRNANNNISHLHPGHRLTNSSDGSNDSGIASTENVPGKHPNILSPYSTVTKPRMMRGSSSGHGSDNSSTISDCLPGNHAFKVRMTGGASSGYESMLRDSEATASGSSAHDSLSEGSCGRVKGSKILKKKFTGSRRSRSAPPSRGASEPSSSPHKSAGRWKDLPPRPKRHEDVDDNDVEIKVYEVDDLDKIPNQRPEKHKPSRIPTRSKIPGFKNTKDKSTLFWSQTL